MYVYGVLNAIHMSQVYGVLECFNAYNDMLEMLYVQDLCFSYSLTTWYPYTAAMLIGIAETTQGYRGSVYPMI